MGEAGIPLVHFYLNMTEPIPEESAARQAAWSGMVEVYRELVRSAESANVRISTHHYHRSDRLLWNYKTMSTLLGELASPYAGVTFCQGKSQMAGDDLAADIIKYGDDIFLFHFRDIVTRRLEQMNDAMEQRFADTGYIEVPFGAGEVDMVGSMRALKQIGYRGTVYPEHYPEIAGDAAAGLAWTIGYMRALDDAIQT